MSEGIPISGEESQSQEATWRPKTMQEVQVQYASEVLTPTLPTIAKSMGKKLAGIRLAHEAACVEDARALLRENRKRTYPDWSVEMSGENVEYGDQSEADEMHIGDVVNNHFNSPPPAPPKQSAPQQAMPQPPVQEAPQPQQYQSADEDLPFFQRIARWIVMNLPLLLALGVIAWLIMSRDQTDYINVPTIDVTGEQ